MRYTQAFVNLILAFLFFGVVSNVYSTTVTNTNDTGPGSLRQAIADTPAGGTVSFALSGCPCTIVLTSGELAFSKSLSIIGPGAQLLTISGNDASRIFNVGEFGTQLQASIVIDGLTVANGLAQLSGGAILIASYQTHLTVRNSRITESRAMSGGGIFANPGGSVSIINSAITGNGFAGSGGSGGGIYTRASDVTIVNSLFSKNQAGFVGGGLLFAGSPEPEEEVLQITDSTFSGNIAGGSAAFDIGNYAIAHITGTTIEGNFADYAVGNYLSTTNFTNCTFSGNTGWTIDNFATDAEEYPDAPSLLTITNSTIVGRVVTDRRCSSCDPANTTVGNSIIAGTGSDPNVSARGDGTFVSLGYNLIGNVGQLFDVFNKPGDQAGTPGSPIDPLLEPVAMNGGPTKTHALRLNSTALDKGKAFGVKTDQRGLSRPNDNPDVPNAQGGDGSDIGAYETQFPLAETVSVSGRVSFSGGVARSRGLVTLTSSSQDVRYASINPLGYFRFTNIPLGRAFTVGLMSKNWSVEPETIFMVEPLTDLDIIANRGP